jgi:uncharacterized membrane protein
MNKAAIITFLKILLFLFLQSSLMTFFYGCSGLPKEHQKIIATDNEIKIPMNEINDGKVHFFTYRKSGKRINFFVRTDSKGDLSAYFDACLTCYKHKKGYRTEGTDLTCNECSMNFRLADAKWDNTKGCSPILIKSVIEKGHLIIVTDNIEKGGRLF